MVKYVKKIAKFVEEVMQKVIRHATL